MRLALRLSLSIPLTLCSSFAAATVTATFSDTMSCLSTSNPFQTVPPVPATVSTGYSDLSNPFGISVQVTFSQTLPANTSCGSHFTVSSTYTGPSGPVNFRATENYQPISMNLSDPNSIIARFNVQGVYQLESPLGFNTPINTVAANGPIGTVSSPQQLDITVNSAFSNNSTSPVTFSYQLMVSESFGPLTPTITSLSPSAAMAGSPGFSLIVNGTGFLSGAIVQWNGSPLTTSYVNGAQLTASVFAGLIASAGIASVTVVNPGGGLSDAVTFTISPQTTGLLITSLSPSSVAAGGPAFTLTVNGTGFVPGSTVQWNGSSLTTSYASGAQLTASVFAGLIANAGIASVTVVNPDGVISNSVAFAINPHALALSISSVSPNFAAAGGAAFTLTVNGSGFVNGAVVLWNGSPLGTIFLGSGLQLTAFVPAFFIANPGTASIAVVNPNGTSSNAVTFTVVAVPGFTNGLRIAQIADGSSWKTLFQVVNLDQSPVSYAFRFWDDNGNPLQLPILNGSVGTLAGTLAPGATVFAETPGTSPTLLQGWAEVLSSGRIGVLTIFRQSVTGRPDSEGTVTGIQSGSRMILPFNNTEGYVDGVAVANTNPSQTLFISLLFQMDNGAQATSSLSLPPHAHTAFVLTSMFPTLAGARGSIQFTASTPDIAVLGLRFSPTNSFTSLGVFQ